MRGALIDSCDALASLAMEASPPAAAVAVGVRAVCNAVLAAEARGVPRDEILTLVSRAREVHALSPFIRRLQSWPRGYPGDFETIEYLLRGEVEAESDGIGFHLEQMALGSPIARQHHHKVRAQAQRIHECLDAEGGSARRLLVLACGSSPDLRALSPELIARAECVVLNDADPDAVSYSMEQLNHGSAAPIHGVEGNAFRVIDRLRALGPFDLVLAGGLFDYLPQRAATTLLHVIRRRLLADRGSVFFTNLAKANPYRPWIEYMADWRLIERSREDIEELVRDGLGTGAVPTLSRDPTRLTWLVDVRVEA